MSNPNEEKQFLIDEIMKMHLSLIELKMFIQEISLKVDSINKEETINWLIDSIESKKELALCSEKIGNTNHAVLKVCKILSE